MRQLRVTNGAFVQITLGVLRGIRTDEHGSNSDLRILFAAQYSLARESSLIRG